MDLIILVLGLALLGLVLWLIETKIPMDPIITWVIRIVIIIVLILWLVRRFGSSIPNVM